jgi:hypothetical protein
MGALNSVAPDVMGRSASAVSQDRILDLIPSGLRDRLRMVTEMPSPSQPGSLYSHQEYALVGPGLQMVETQVVLPDEPVSDHLPLLLRLRWAFRESQPA